ncbi:MAG: four helix bundle protein [Ekhidna sp.]|uniref:four helix bundle protein n=1 Tax=Ekhidna sp. TaxID=2608089 RepID=UPI0032EFA6CD
MKVENVLMMAKIESFEELDCWKSSKELTILIYDICESEKFKTEFFAKDQLKRAALSSMNNIAEGFGRFSNKEFIRFLNFSTASLDEVHSMILLYSELGYISDMDKIRAIEILKKSKHQTLAFIKYLRTKL